MKELGIYKLIDRLGVGGMAEVFLAHARRQGNFVQPCVVKILHPQLARDEAFTRLILEEARLIAHLRHSNIASLYDVDRHGDAVFLVMEYVDGRDLHAILSRSVAQQTPLPISFALHVAKHLCAGLHFAHTRQGPDGEPLALIHRDVSPQNILVSTLGEVKLIDFGVAKFNSRLREKTRAGVIKGKFGYMSPEQAWDEDLDQRSDLFSVGICLYEMLTGRSVYGQNEDAMVMLKRAREADIEPITRYRPEIPDKLADLVHRALAANRIERWQSAHEMERRLTALLSTTAPDYTPLDAGLIVEDLFELGDPAIEDISGRLSEDPPKSELDDEPPPAIRKSRGPGGRGGTRPIVEETTQPMAEVPDRLQRSGRHVAERPVKPSDHATPDEATVAITFSEDELDDFREEKTNLIEHPSPSRPLPRPGGARRKGKPRRDAAQHTRRIEEDLDDKETDPRRETLGARQSGRFASMHELPDDDLARMAAEAAQASRSEEPPSVLVADEISLDTSVLEQNRRDLRERARRSGAQPVYDGTDQLPMMEVEERPPPDGTDQLQQHQIRQAANRGAKEVASASNGPGAGPENWLQDRRVQVGAALTFVVLAAIFMISRLFF